MVNNNRYQICHMYVDNILFTNILFNAVLCEYTLVYRLISSSVRIVLGLGCCNIINIDNYITKSVILVSKIHKIFTVYV